jgi:hypothetical protein
LFSADAVFLMTHLSGIAMNVSTNGEENYGKNKR